MKQASIILITYNSQSFITECLNSLYKTTGIDKSEIIVLENASTDNTVEIINKNYPTVHLFESKENLGFGSAVNKAMTHVSSDFIVLLNPDTQVSKNWLLPLLDTLKKNTNVAAVNSKTKIVSNNLEFIQNAGNYVFSDGHSRDRGAVVSKRF